MGDRMDVLREQAARSGDIGSLINYIENKYSMRNHSDVYHYTNVSGFMSIIQNGEFWLSHIRFMNDRKEYLEGREKCEKIIKDFIAERHKDKEEFLNRILDRLDSEISTGFYSITSKDVFSLSLSHSRDSLDMWRGYGNNSGIALGFDINKCNMELPGFAMVRDEQYKEDLKKYDNNYEIVNPDHEKLFCATNVIYEDDIKEAVLEDVLEVSIEYFDYLRNNGLNWADECAVECAISALFSIFPYLKNSGFKNEEECRIVQNYVYGEKEVPLKVYYRERNGLIVPYVKYALLDRNCRPLKQWPIKEIVIGPGLKQKDVAEGVRYFLNQQGLKELAERVVCSEIPYVGT